MEVWALLMRAPHYLRGRSTNICRGAALASRLDLLAFSGDQARPQQSPVFRSA